MTGSMCCPGIATWLSRVMFSVRRAETATRGGDSFDITLATVEITALAPVLYS